MTAPNKPKDELPWRVMENFLWREGDPLYDRVFLIPESEARALLALKERVAKFEDHTAYLLSLKKGDIIDWKRLMSDIDLLREAMEGTKK